MENKMMESEESMTMSKLTQELAQLKEKMIGQQKLVGLGMLCAGSAHEIKNPLNFIANFAVINLELFTELESKLKEILPLQSAGLEETNELLEQLRQNSQKIMEHARRVESIVVSMLSQARGSSTAQKIETDLHQLIDEALNLSFHGMRAFDPSFNVKFEKEYDPQIKEIKVVREELTRVLHNLLHNAYYATRQKKRQVGNSYQPIINLKTQDLAQKVKITIRDNGEGIAPQTMDKLFTPFFTTKSPLEGSGLGLAISKAIISEMHHGEIRLHSEEGCWTELVIILPKT